MSGIDTGAVRRPCSHASLKVNTYRQVIKVIAHFLKTELITNIMNLKIMRLEYFSETNSDAVHTLYLQPRFNAQEHTRA